MGIVRPASQPNVHFARPHPPHVGMFQENHFGISPHLHAGRTHAGHKRQRSRSVPLPVDFSMLHGPMPTFHVQQASPVYTPEGHHNLFQPVPQNPNHGPVNPNLRIDTTSGYGLDYRSFPMSATATSPSEYASPGFFPVHTSHTPMPAADFNTSYNMPFLSPSPMVDHSSVVPQSVTPMSHMSHQEPMIVNGSPPLTGMPRSASADMFTMGHDGGMTDEGLMLSEMYSKQSLNMPMPSPSFDENGLLNMGEMSEFHTPREHMDMPSTPFGTIDPNSLQNLHR